jgi:hypothetical protein
LVVRLVTGTDAYPKLPQKISCEAPKALRSQEGEFPNGFKQWISQEILYDN